METMFEDIIEYPLNVNCLKKNWVIETLYCQYQKQQNGFFKTLGVNICDNGSGDSTCEECKSLARKKIENIFNGAR